MWYSVKNENHKFMEEWTVLAFRYDTQLLIEGKNLDEDTINEYFTHNWLLEMMK